jgi:DNA-binding GntR family transcriptional regulator
MSAAETKKTHAMPLAAPKSRPAAASDATRKIVRTTTVELVTTAIRQRILSGDLADELGVSRVPIREAITRLTGEGLLTNVPHKGAYVAELSIEEVQETFEIRLRLEPWLFSQAIPHITEGEIARAENLVTEMDGAESGMWGQLNWRFHETLYVPAHRDITLQMLRVLHDRSDRYFRFQVKQVPIRQQSHDEHMAMVAACRKRDAKLGAKLLEQHVKIAAQQIVAVVEAIMAR